MLCHAELDDRGRLTVANEAGEMQITIGTDGASRRPPVIGEPVRVIGVTAIDCAPPPITMGEPAVWVTLSTGVTAPAATVPDTTYTITAPSRPPRRQSVKVLFTLSEIARLRNDLFPSVCDIQGDSAERPLVNSHARHES